MSKSGALLNATDEHIAFVTGTQPAGKAAHTEQNPKQTPADLTQRAAYDGSALAQTDEEIESSSQNDPSSNEADILGAAITGVASGPTAHVAMGAADLRKEVEILRNTPQQPQSHLNPKPQSHFPQYERKKPQRPGMGF